MIGVIIVADISDNSIDLVHCSEGHNSEPDTIVVEER